VLFPYGGPTVNRTRFLALVAAAVVAFGLISAPSASAGAAERSARASTPRLLNRAVADGAVSRAQADLYLVYALGGDERLPSAFRSSAPWRGTLPLLHLRQRIQAMEPGPQRSALERELELQGVFNCGGETGGVNNLDTTHFHIEYSTVGGGLTIADYGTSLETSWSTEVTTFGWAAPPLTGARYTVVVSATMGSGLYGFVTTTGTAGNNPNTPWNEGDARYSCMALNADYGPFPGTPQQALDATTAHEFNHSLQFGYGALNGTVPGSDFIEGGATWMEDEVFDGSNDNYNYLWPNFADGMNSYNASPYPYWITFRGLTERFGANTAGGGEQVMEDFWELVSQNTSNNSAALATALVNKGTNLPDAFHAYAVAAKFLRACGGAYSYPYCFEEGPAYAAAAGATAAHKTIASVGNSATGTFEALALNWVTIPKNAGIYDLTLKNTGAGGQLRGSAVCDTGSGFVINPFPAVVGAGVQTNLTGFNSAGCTSAVAVLTNQATSGTVSYQLTTGGGGGGSSNLTINNVRLAEGNSGSKQFNFTVTLAPSSSGTVTVNYATQNLTATAGSDYQQKSGTLTFVPGDTSETISITVFGDTALENSERFKVVLSNASGATILDNTGVGAIQNDD
jgi:hypothetical protein